MRVVRLDIGDPLLLCSDGLTGMTDDNCIRRILHAAHPNADAACRELVATAIAAGGSDNVTALVMSLP